MAERVELSQVESDALANMLQPLVSNFIGMPLDAKVMSRDVMAACQSHGFVVEVEVVDAHTRRERGATVLYGPYLNIQIVGRCPGAITHAPEWAGP